MRVKHVRTGIAAEECDGRSMEARGPILRVRHGRVPAATAAGWTSAIYTMRTGVRFPPSACELSAASYRANAVPVPEVRLPGLKFSDFLVIPDLNIFPEK